MSLLFKKSNYLWMLSLLLLMSCGDDDDDDDDSDLPAINLTVETITPTGANYSGHDGLSIDAQGNLYVSDLASGSGTTIFKVTPDGTATVFIDDINGPAGHTFLSNGNLIVSDFNSRKLHQISPDGERSNFLSNPGFRGGTLAIGSDGSIYHTSFANNRLYKITSDLEVSTIVDGLPLNVPFGVALDANDIIYVANFSDGNITRIDQDGTTSNLVRLPSSIGYLIHANGKLYATGFTSHNIYQVELDGTFIVLAGTGTSGNDDGNQTEASFFSPNGIAATPDGRTFYVSQRDATIRKITLL